MGCGGGAGAVRSLGLPEESSPLIRGDTAPEAGSSRSLLLVFRGMLVSARAASRKSVAGLRVLRVGATLQESARL